MVAMIGRGGGYCKENKICQLFLEIETGPENGPWLCFGKIMLLSTAQSLEAFRRVVLIYSNIRQTNQPKLHDR